MPARRNTHTGTSAPSTKRIRRNEETLIAALQARIVLLQERSARKAAKADPVLRLAAKLVRQLRRAERQFMEAGRTDLANSVKVAGISLMNTAIPSPRT